MKRTSQWAGTLCFSFLFTSLIAFYRGYYVDATMLSLYAGSGIFFILSPRRAKNYQKKDYRWNTFKIISYLMFICALAVALFKYMFLEISPV
jgi:hypothetical protein